MQRLGMQLGVPLQFVPRFVQGDCSQLWDVVALLEEARRSLMPKIMEAQIFDPQLRAGASEGRADGIGVVGEDRSVCSRFGLALHDVPCRAPERDRLWLPAFLWGVWRL